MQVSGDGRRRTGWQADCGLAGWLGRLGRWAGMGRPPSACGLWGTNHDLQCRSPHHTPTPRTPTILSLSLVQLKNMGEPLSQLNMVRWVEAGRGVGGVGGGGGGIGQDGSGACNPGSPGWGRGGGQVVGRPGGGGHLPPCPKPHTLDGLPPRPAHVRTGPARDLKVGGG
jgi:hypothetical protein